MSTEFFEQPKNKTIQDEVIKELQEVSTKFPYQRLSQILFNAIDLYLLDRDSTMSFFYLEDSELLEAIRRYKDREFKNG